MSRASDESAAFRHRLNRIYIRSTLGFIVFVAAVAALEQMGLPRRWIGVVFLLATVGLYAGINSFTTLVAKAKAGGREIYRGRPRAGDKPMV